MYIKRKETGFIKTRIFIYFKSGLSPLQSNFLLYLYNDSVPLTVSKCRLFKRNHKIVFVSQNEIEDQEAAF